MLTIPSIQRFIFQLYQPDLLGREIQMRLATEVLVLHTSTAGVVGSQ